MTSESSTRPQATGAPPPRPDSDRPQEGRPYGDRPQGGRSYGDRPQGGRPSGDRPQQGGDRPQGGRREGGGGRRFYPRRRVCLFCADKEAVMDYKQPETLRRFISERARIEPRRKTSTCSRHQRALAKQIKRARQAGLIPFTTDTLHDLQPSR